MSELLRGNKAKRPDSEGLGDWVPPLQLKGVRVSFVGNGKKIVLLLIRDDDLSLSTSLVVGLLRGKGRKKNSAWGGIQHLVICVSGLSRGLNDVSRLFRKEQNKNSGRLNKLFKVISRRIREFQNSFGGISSLWKYMLRRTDFFCLPPRKRVQASFHSVGPAIFLSCGLFFHFYLPGFGMCMLSYNKATDMFFFKKVIYQENIIILMHQRWTWPSAVCKTHRHIHVHARSLICAYVHWALLRGFNFFRSWGEI